VRPLVVCKAGKPVLTQEHINDLALGLKDFPDFIRQGIIEYLDVNEENNCFIALSEKEVRLGTTHMEIDPFTILGVVAGLIPYPHHN
jgi:DNA-directed RNA polymerase III subunit RPC2